MTMESFKESLTGLTPEGQPPFREGPIIYRPSTVRMNAAFMRQKDTPNAERNASAFCASLMKLCPLGVTT